MTDNLIYLDEARREHWIHKLEHARETGAVAIFGAMQPVEAVILPFPDIKQEGDKPS